MMSKKNTVIALALATTVTVGGCTGEIAKWSSEERAKPAIVELVSHQINLQMLQRQPTAGSKEKLDVFLENISVNRNAEVWVLSPDPQSADHVVSLLENLGIEPTQIRLTPFEANEIPSTVTIRVDQFLLNLAECTDWSNGNLINSSNRNSSNLGCSVDRNLALTLVNPRDLVRGRSLDMASGQTAVNAVRRYYSDKLKPLPDSNTSNFLNN
ncbi:MAG: hypothetical protein JKX94_12635 [Sneathiella sp.]|nr:hypothetical protein [Sneathiella sp.]